MLHDALRPAPVPRARGDRRVRVGPDPGAGRGGGSAAPGRKADASAVLASTALTSRKPAAAGTAGGPTARSRNSLAGTAPASGACWAGASPTKREKRQRRPVSRVLFPEPVSRARDDDHFSRTPVARRLQRPNPRARAGHPIALLFGLAPGGVCRAGAVARAAGELLPHRFTLTVR